MEIPAHHRYQFMVSTQRSFLLDTVFKNKKNEHICKHKQRKMNNSLTYIWWWHWHIITR